MAARRRAGRGARVDAHGRGGARVCPHAVAEHSGQCRPSTGPRAARRVAEALRLRCGARAHLPVLSIQPLCVEYSILTLAHRHSE